MSKKPPTPDLSIRRFRFDTLDAAKSAAEHARGSRHGKHDLSIVVPCYNVEKYVADTCHSLVANSRHIDLEVILVDDGSVDNSIDVAEKILLRAKVPTTTLSIPNSGLSAARNAGLNFVSSPYVAFLDADDLMASDAYAHMCRLAISKKCDQVFARSSAFEDSRFNDFEFFDSEIWNLILSGLSSRVFRPLSEPAVFQTEPKTCTRIWRTEFLRKHGLEFPEGRIFEDIGFHMRAIALSDKIGVVDVQGLIYRMGRSTSLTLDTSRKRFDVIANVAEALATPELQNLPGEAGAFALLGLMRICNWCREMVDLRMKREFDENLALCYEDVPRSWVAALDQINSREANRFLTSLAVGPWNKIKLSSAYHRFARRGFKKMRLAMPGWKGLGIDTHGAVTSSKRRYHFSETRSYGPSLSMLQYDASLVFLSPASRANALRIARTRPDAMIYAVDNVMDSISFELRQIRNVHLFGSPNELMAAIRKQDIRLAMVDLGDDATLHLLASLQGLSVDFIVGAFDPLAVQSTSTFLVAARSQVRRGYFLWRHDGQRYTYARSSEGPAVSVVVPIYNVLPYLDQCIANLCAQTLMDREIILVDDGSTDGSAIKCDQWAAKDPTIRVVHKSNGGCASARMAGLEAALGEYVTFIDGDDWVDPNMFERLLHLSLLTGDNIVESGWCFAFPSGTNEDRTKVERAQCYIGSGGVMRRPRDLALIDQPTIWRRLYRRAFLCDQKIGFDERLKRFDDMPFQFSTLIKSDDLAYDDFCGTFYRQGREGQDIGATDERLFVHFPIMNLLRETALGSGSKNAYKKFLMIQYHTHAWALSKINPELREKYCDFAARDLFGPEQYGGALSNLNRLMRLLPQYRLRLLRLYLRFMFSARRTSLPEISEVT